MTTTNVDQNYVVPNTPDVSHDVRVYAPAVDVYDHEQEWMLLVEMPGVSEKSVEVSVDKGILTVEGKVEVPVLEGYTLARAEYDVTRYRRAFEISDRVDSRGVRANMKNGVLRLTLPKKEEAKARKIEVTVE
jgi:HSP20 family molecular chaperone IbpA